MKHRMAMTGEASDLTLDRLTAEDHRVGRTQAPKSRSVLHTIIHAHIWLSLAGAVVGAVAFAIMISLGVQFIVLSPWWSALLLIGFGTIGGLIVGGAVSLWPRAGD